MSFSKEQAYAFEQFKRGHNLFITGPGGTGKTYLIKSIVNHMNQQNAKYQVCAMTGCAAVLLQCGARTLHSWSGMGLANGPISTIVQKIVRNKKAAKLWKTTNILIVDEVSMMSKKIFELIEFVARCLRRSEKPFGGMQVVFTGDFYQLPPVGNSEEPDTAMFCFQSQKWENVFQKENHIQLTTIFRQQSDENYKRILNQVRIGELDQECRELLANCVGKTPPTQEHMPTKIYAIRSKTDYVNTSTYNKIQKPEYTYEFQVRTDLTTYLETSKIIDPILLASCRKIPKEVLENEVNMLINTSNRNQILRLKEGAKVMCLHNVDLTRDICNGSQGIVTKFVGPQNAPVVKFQNGVEMTMEFMWIQSEEIPCIAVGQIPLCLAWALTIHKIQGATLESAEMDLGNSVFEFGQTYVALSRIKTLQGLHLSAFEPAKIRANPDVKEFYDKISEYSVGISLEEVTEVTEVFEPTENIFAQFANKELETEEFIPTDTTVKKIRMIR